MRRLLYVPILHIDQDFGQLSADIQEQARAVVGEDNLQRHKQIILLYWQTIARYWDGKDVSGLKLFQDGMVADGPLGRKIVEDLAEAGSINYKIVAHLLERGAELVKTEDPELLKEEYFLTRELVQQKPLLATIRAFLRYRWRKNTLLKARDTFIAESIAEHLGEGETGVCFIGASHRILPRLPGDIEVIALKNPQKVQAYTQQFAHKNWQEVDRSGNYLTTPIGTE